MGAAKKEMCYTFNILFTNKTNDSIYILDNG